MCPFYTRFVNQRKLNLIEFNKTTLSLRKWNCGFQNKTELVRVKDYIRATNSDNQFSSR